MSSVVATFFLASRPVVTQVYTEERVASFSCCNRIVGVVTMLDMTEKKSARSGKSLGVYVSPKLADAFARYIEQSRPRTTRTAIIEMLLEQFLGENGFWPEEQQEPPPDEPKGRRNKK